MKTITHNQPKKIMEEIKWMDFLKKAKNDGKNVVVKRILGKNELIRLYKNDKNTHCALYIVRIIKENDDYIHITLQYQISTYGFYDGQIYYDYEISDVSECFDEYITRIERDINYRIGNYSLGGN